MLRKIIGLSVTTLIIGCAGGLEEEDVQTGNIGANEEVSSPPVVSIKNAVIQERSGKGTVSINLDKTSPEPIELNLSYQDVSSYAGIDYYVGENDITIQPNERLLLVDIEVENDDIYEVDETFKIVIDEANNANIGNKEAIVTIRSEDPKPVISFSSRSTTVEENAGIVDISVVLDRASSNDIEINSNISGTAQKDFDYLSLNNNDLKISAGEKTGYFNIEVLQDSLREGGETVKLEIDSGAGYNVSGTSVHALIISGDTSLNDTGYSQYSNEIEFDSYQKFDDYEGQDADYGLDSLIDNIDEDGMDGFSFTKLDGAGNEIPIVSNNWSCVLDNRTGLIWEKNDEFENLFQYVDDEGKITGTTNNYRAANYKYTWYTEDVTNNGRSNGAPNDPFEGKESIDLYGYCAYRYEEDFKRPYRLRCNTDVRIRETNWYGHCGSKKWRLPNLEELRSLVNYSDNLLGHIESSFFPTLESNAKILSGTPSAEFDASVWCLDTSDGEMELCHKGSLNNVMLVSDTE
ncbi:hypothetical protein A3715_15490 [Oleiphilus sp. HI0009]|nr:hypothetical protein A3715_15490 [Oleiphilus sp. HI0009]